uniref:Uncharacterized protein AlNc14C24G2440 n=1 Tax=Albugo laibachii Nc14 TaxID=890382 RepID=F0W6E0_9STRA|nr:conserved hypothetical protein [Albugo laibachii Nc14]|eukprot:CCA16684.1 conserved hypothetical protein [Albugo laibachii Nc14]
MAFKMKGRQLPPKEVDALIDVVVAAQLDRESMSYHGAFRNACDIRSPLYFSHRSQCDASHVTLEEREIDELRSEVVQLTDDIGNLLRMCGDQNQMKNTQSSSVYLRIQQHAKTVHSMQMKRKKALKEKKALERANNYREELHSLLIAQQRYLDTLRSLVAFAPVSDVRLALMTPLESYVYLEKDWERRRCTIESMREEKLMMAIKFLNQKTNGLDLEKPHFYTDTFERFGKVYITRFVSVRIQGKTLEEALRIYLNVTLEQDKKIMENVGQKPVRQTLECKPSKYVYQRILNRLKTPSNDKVYRIESNSLCFTDYSQNQKVIVHDYVDVDELIPYQTTEAIRKDYASGLIISAHFDTKTRQPFLLSRRYTLVRYHLIDSVQSSDLGDALKNECTFMMGEASRAICQQLDTKYRYVPELDEAVVRFG